MTRLRQFGGFSVLTFVLALACGSEGDGSGTGAGGAGQGGAGGTASGGASSGGASSGGASSGGASSGGQGSGGETTGGGNGGGAGGSSSVDLDELGQSCDDGTCPAGLTPTQHCGIAGCDETTFCTCEISCEDDSEVCPEGTVCATVSDGPGDVCVRS